ncbi:MAG: ferrous iron transport protein A [Saprospiraceae bacterium]|jgi:ferrous iron transport protein A|nr:ferrous iron transport protein A [Saprospiraceae bacterium]
MHNTNVLKEGYKYTLISYNNDVVASKLMSMGLLPGSELVIIRKAPFGGGFYIKLLENCCIALSSTEANSLVLKKIN